MSKAMTPKIVHSDLTHQWYVVTRYTIKKQSNDSGMGVLVAHTKYDVTEQMNEIIDAEIADAIADHDRELRNEVERGRG